jgi:hypothetical protein
MRAANRRDYDETSTPEPYATRRRWRLPPWRGDRILAELAQHLNQITARKAELEGTVLRFSSPEVWRRHCAPST